MYFQIIRKEFLHAEKCIDVHSVFVSQEMPTFQRVNKYLCDYICYSDYPTSFRPWVTIRIFLFLQSKYRNIRMAIHFHIISESWNFIRNACWLPILLIWSHSSLHCTAVVQYHSLMVWHIYCVKLSFKYSVSTPEPKLGAVLQHLNLP